ncbi:MAG: hypothetical protein ACK47B_24750 [Armatimonadota bacterium]
MASVDELAAETKRAFGFLAEHGFTLAGERQHWPESFKGGFELTYASAASRIRIHYGDMELTVDRDGEELFGPTNRGSFHGNMFSRENLLLALERIANDVQGRLER